ncbi:MAG TPA: tetratricopeptide repeat protein [Bacteroidales bacterium]|jgi:tetratricopeptide (TPR) repeat protein|nr:MAG: tetratricopeptide repeat protein [Bacteroidetes bacterium ADurb.Bin012]HNQ59835.1 tetratricopeptide repeat protein [Bacteroidales bacterium]HNU21424.1 tetratricopeptide repeat protein [Bacteroidales bacterium]HNV16970.1 tetratricopeptide repeat protein [Bacteroidales bacterium]HOC15482.1 tetratricopeptide repeat protein [Bacteroidales bacterium]
MKIFNINLFLIYFALLCASNAFAQIQDTLPNKFIGENIRIDEQAKYLEALKFVLQGDDSTAAQILALILMNNPDNHTAAFELSKIYYSQGNFYASAVLMENAVKLNPNNYWYWKQLLDSYEATGNEETYMKYFALFISRFPDKPEDYRKYLDVLIKNQKYDEAISFIDKLISKNIVNEEIIIKKFELLLKKDKKKDAICVLNNYLTKYPCSESIMLVLSNYYFQNKKDKDALSILDDLLNCDTNNEIASLTLAEYYNKKGKNDKAFKYLLKAFNNPQITVNNKIQYLLNFYSLDNIKASDTAQILKLVGIISQVHNQEPNSKILAGNIYFVSQYYAEAAKEYEAAIDLKVNNYEVYEKLLLCYAALENNDKLKSLADKVIELYPYQPLPYYFSGFVSFIQKKYTESGELLEKSLKYSGRNSNLTQFLYRLLAEVNSNLQDYDKSDYYFELALQSDSSDATLLNNYSYSLAERKKDLEKALKMSEKALSINPKEPSYLDTYGWILYRLGRYDEAIVYLKKAVEKTDNTNDAVLWEHLGDAYYKIGNIDEALKNWMIASEKEGSSEKLLQKIKDKMLYE